MIKTRTVMALTLGATLAAIGPSRADELSDLKAQLRAQQEALQQMQAQLQAVQEKQAAEAKPAAAATAAAPAASSDLPGGFQIPGTNTSMKISGYVKLDMVDDVKGTMGTSSTAKTMADMTAIPLDGSVNARRNGQFNMGVRESRLNLTTLTPTEGYGPLKVVLEGDFYGSGSSNSTSYFRLRHAYGSLGRVLAGQTWSTFMDIDTYSPETLDFGGPVGGAFLRQSQVRYSQPLAGGKLDFALESPLGDLSSQTSDSHIDKAPDLIARYSIDPSWGHVAVAAMGRYLATNDGKGAQDGTLAYGVLAGVGISTFGKDMLTLQTVDGNGVGRYLNQGQGISAVVGTDNQLRTIDIYGGTIGYSHFWTDALRSNVAFGYDYFSAPSKIESLMSTHANLIWSPIPQVDVGLEYIWGQITYHQPVTDSATGVSAASGSAHRVEGSIKYSF